MLSFSYFINEDVQGSVQDIFKAVMEYIEKEDNVDLQHLYIDGSKFEANANKYTIFSQPLFSGTTTMDDALKSWPGNY